MSLNHIIEYCEISKAIFKQKHLKIEFCPFPDKPDCKYRGYTKLRTDKVGEENLYGCMFPEERERFGKPVFYDDIDM